MKNYDALYIFAGNAKDDVLESHIEKALAEVTRVGGQVVNKEILGKRTFAHLMHKRENGVYVLVRMALEPAKVTELVNRYKLVEEVFRVQFLAVDERREGIIAKQREAAAKREALKQQTAAPVEDLDETEE